MMLEQLLAKHFGYQTFRAGQKEVIQSLMDGQDVIALLPTGMGKSLCYQLPGYILGSPVLVISPLLSLMQDQVEQMKRYGEKRVVALNSFLSADDRKYALQHLQQYRFIFTSPEMLLQPQVRDKITQMTLSLIVVDEAHCISQWGFDFRPHYLRIGELFNGQQRPPVLALSATATQKVIGDIQHYLHMHDPFLYIHSVDRPNIHLGRLTFHDKQDKIQWITGHVLSTSGPGIIYTQSRAKAERISEWLRHKGIQVAAYHAGLEAADRQFIQQQFIDCQLEWIVATNAFGMGVHKEDIRQVIHETMSSNIANYMQEIGRAGRDGQDALAVLLYADGDEDFTKMIATDDIPKSVHIERFVSLQSTGQSTAQMVAQGEISETAFRVLDYWMRTLSASDVKKKLHDMTIEKWQAVDAMMQLIRGELCLREVLVTYFGQTLSKKPHNCCQQCGLNFSEIVTVPQREIVESGMLRWEERLRQLLL